MALKKRIEARLRRVNAEHRDGILQLQDIVEILACARYSGYSETGGKHYYALEPDRTVACVIRRSDGAYVIAIDRAIDSYWRARRPAWVQYPWKSWAEAVNPSPETPVIVASAEEVDELIAGMIGGNNAC